LKLRRRFSDNGPDNIDRVLSQLMNLMAEYSDNWCSNHRDGDLMIKTEYATFSDAKGEDRRDKFFIFIRGNTIKPFI
jgi:hypothetical protein